MRRPRNGPFLSFLAAAATWTWMATAPQLAAAGPYPRDDIHDLGFGFVMPRQCAQYCGYNNKYCCSEGTVCYTSNGIADCKAGGTGYVLYTTTWTETNTFTRTVSSYFPAATTQAPLPCIPAPGSGHIACGSICCASDQYCAWENQCSANGGNGGGPVYTGGTTVITSAGSTITTQFSAPYRPTSSSFTTTGTAANDTIGAGGSTGGGLSAGAIAGIVLGTLAGIILLVIICFCCIVRGLWHAVAALLGFGKKDKRSEKTTTVTEERYSRYGGSAGGHSRRDSHRTWFGMGSGRPSGAASRKDEKKSSGMGWLGLAGAAGTILLLLGLKKEKKKPPRSRPSRSSYSSDSWTRTSSSPSRRTARTVETRRTYRSRRTSAAPPLSPRASPRDYPPSSRRHSRPPSDYRGGSRAPPSRRPSHSRHS